ncbi:hypothetical protein WJX81_004290 [Elliptochloris bilobata]|uniref:Hydroxyproline O-arabinosyltransferase-like domain-containing protein n=1 Tax=Elliptochloris bilobata TaxID=381761 RepID=A0AAW1RHK8_9CHLO
MHTVVPSSCTREADWQVVGLYYSFLRARQPGLITRLAGCTHEELKHRTSFWVMPTWVTESAINTDGDSYTAYNKPWTVWQWVSQAQPQEDFVLVLDPDVLIRRPILPDEFRVVPGHPAAFNAWCLRDLNKLMMPRLMPDAPRRLDYEAAPYYNRTADEVGNYYFLHREDLANLAPLWWNYTLNVRTFFVRYPELVNVSTETDAAPVGKSVWVAEMYGHALGAAHLGLRYRGFNDTNHHPPGDPVRLSPLMTHYGWDMRMPESEFVWFKHNFVDHDGAQCPPWRLTENATLGGLFPHPVFPSLLRSQGKERNRDLLNIEVVAALNQAHCRLHHLRSCLPSEELARECGRAARVMQELDMEWERLAVEHFGGDLECADTQEDCAAYLTSVNGECRRGDYGYDTCRRASPARAQRCSVPFPVGHI